MGCRDWPPGAPHWSCCSALVVLAGVLSLAIGSRPISPARSSTSSSTPTARGLDDRARAAPAPHHPRDRRRHGPRRRRRADAGPHPQPAGRPRTARRRGRRVLRGGPRDLRLRRRRPSPATPGSRWPAPARLRRGVRDRLHQGRPRPGLAGARRHRRERPARGPDPGASSCATSTPSTTTASGWSAPRPAATWTSFWQVLPFIVVGLLLAASHAPALNLLQLGDDVAPRWACTRCGTRCSASSA